MRPVEILKQEHEIPLSNLPKKTAALAAHLCKAGVVYAKGMKKSPAKDLPRDMETPDQFSAPLSCESRPVPFGLRLSLWASFTLRCAFQAAQV